jgi:hypothetical protein
MSDDVHVKREKDLLLDAYDQEQNRVKNISFKNLLYVFGAVLLFFMVVLPKIYISNQIYYTSKEMNTMYHTYMALREENVHLRHKLELIRYQVEVLDELEESAF